MDYNNDGKKDLISGDTNGQVWLFLNVGTEQEPKLAEGKRIQAGGKPIVGQRNWYRDVDGTRVLEGSIAASYELAQRLSKIHLADWDGDGLKDLLIGQDFDMLFYKNAGTESAPRFLEPVLMDIPGHEFPRRPAPYVVDWDGDGKKDLLVGSEDSLIRFYRNAGSAEAPRLQEAKVIPLKAKGFNEGFRWRIEMTDWNNDGKQDLLIGNIWRETSEKRGGNLWLFLAK